MRDDAKVSWIHAPTNAANVINLKASRDWTDIEHISRRVGVPRWATGGASEHAIAAMIQRREPRPAIFRRAFHKVPLEENQRGGASCVHAATALSMAGSPRSAASTDRKSVV